MNEQKLKFYQGTLSPQRHREFEFLEKSLALVQKKGLRSLTFEEVARSCRVSRALLHHYFESRDHLIGRLLELATFDLQLFVQNSVGEDSRGEMTGREELQSYCQATLDWVEARPKYSHLILLFFQLATESVEIRRRNDQLSASGRQRILAMLSRKEGNTTWNRKQGQKTVEMAHLIQVLLTGAVVGLLSENLSPRERQRLKEAVVNQCLELAMGDPQG